MPTDMPTANRDSPHSQLVLLYMMLGNKTLSPFVSVQKVIDISQRGDLTTYQLLRLRDCGFDFKLTSECHK